MATELASKSGVGVVAVPFLGILRGELDELVLRSALDGGGEA